MAHKLEKAIEKGNSFFDFMGSDPKDLSLIRFKEKWGAQSKDICTYVKDYHTLRCRIWEMGKKFSSSKMGRGLVRILQR